MKIGKKIPAALGVACAMTFALMPLAAWTRADAETVETPVQSTAISSVQPLYGGQASKVFTFSNSQTVTVSLDAENWIWPWADAAIVTISSDSPDTYYGFRLKFVWTNDSSKATVWSVPSQYSTNTHAPLKLLEPSNGVYKVSLEKNCDDGSLSGSPGSRWACEQIEVVFSVRIGSEPVQTHTFSPVHF